jgi:hypothetical protein
MSESHVVSGLVAKRSELSGLIDHYMHEIKRMDADLHHLDAAIKMFDPDFDLRAIRVKQHRKKNLYFKQGESARLVLDALRENGGVMSTEAVALAMLKKKKLDVMDKDVLVFFKKAAITALRHQANRELVKNAGRVPDGITLLWELV